MDRADGEAAAEVAEPLLLDDARSRRSTTPKDIIDFANTRGADKIIYAGYFPMGLSLDRIFSELPDVPFRDHVWPKFLRENAARVLKLGADPSSRGLACPARSPASASSSCPNIGPVQFAGMLLADMGADVLRLDRATDVATGSNVAGFVSPYSVIDRGRRSVGIDLKHPDAAEVVLRLCEQADVLLEGFRPGVAERLGVGPDACRARNDRLVYARMTGLGPGRPARRRRRPRHQLPVARGRAVAHRPRGPRAGAADQPARRLRRRRRARRDGHPRRARRAGDVAARARSVDAAMVDGSAQLMSIFFGIDAMGGWGDRGTNLLDGGAHFYNVYETADGEYVSIASYEPKFYANLLRAARRSTTSIPRSRWTARSGRR